MTSLIIFLETLSPNEATCAHIGGHKYRCTELQHSILFVVGSTYKLQSSVLTIK